MGRVVVTEFITLDGVVQAPGDPSEFDRGGWAVGTGEQAMAFKQRHERDILVAGSAQLARGLVDLDLVDRLHLMVFPLVLSEGARLFGATEMPKPFRLVESKPVENGIVIFVYELEAR